MADVIYNLFFILLLAGFLLVVKSFESLRHGASDE